MNIMLNYATLIQIALSFTLKLKMINHESDINKNIYVNDPYEAKYQYLTNNLKKQAEMIIIPKLLLNTQMMCKMFIKILKNQSRKKT